jgi:hypothetical protein
MISQKDHIFNVLILISAVLNPILLWAFYE